MSKLLILGLVIVILLLIIVFLTIDELIRVWKDHHRHTFDPNSDCQFFVGQDRYELLAGTEVCIGQNITVSFAKNTQATIKIRGDVSGDVITDRGSIIITGNVSGEARSRFGDVIINGNHISTESPSEGVVGTSSLEAGILSNS